MITPACTANYAWQSLPALHGAMHALCKSFVNVSGTWTPLGNVERQFGYLLLLLSLAVILLQGTPGRSNRSSLALACVLPMATRLD